MFTNGSGVKITSRTAAVAALGRRTAARSRLAHGRSRLALIPHRHSSLSYLLVTSISSAEPCGMTGWRRFSTGPVVANEETSVPNQRRRKISTAFSAVAALTVASPFAVIPVSWADLRPEGPRARGVHSRGGRDRPAQRDHVRAAGGALAVRHQPAAAAGGLSPAGAQPVQTGPLTAPGLTTPSLSRPDHAQPGHARPDDPERHGSGSDHPGDHAGSDHASATAPGLTTRA